MHNKALTAAHTLVLIGVLYRYLAEVNHAGNYKSRLLSRDNKSRDNNPE